MDAVGQSKKRSVVNGELVLHWGDGKRLRGVKKEGCGGSDSPGIAPAAQPMPNASSHNNGQIVKRARKIHGQREGDSRSSPSAASLHKVPRRYSDAPFPLETVNKVKSKPGIPPKSLQVLNADKPVANKLDTNGFCPTKQKEKLADENKHVGFFPGGSFLENSKILDALLPKFMVALSHKEKEEDFMAIKGSKLPQRPKKRAKFAQKAVHCISPGAWLCELSLDRYEVREKKSLKKKLWGLKALAIGESGDSDKS